nr:uncharacterized protein LOC129163239 [Nothobranchius furzeri]XP_054596053.1 uncharacterized protein LOC129163239 [Nothobranchius furzeri]
MFWRLLVSRLLSFPRLPTTVLPSDEKDILATSIHHHIGHCHRVWDNSTSAFNCTLKQDPAPQYVPGQQVWLYTLIIPLKFMSCKMSPRFVVLMRSRKLSVLLLSVSTFFPVSGSMSSLVLWPFPFFPPCPLMGSPPGWYAGLWTLVGIAGVASFLSTGLRFGGSSVGASLLHLGAISPNPNPLFLLLPLGHLRGGGCWWGCHELVFVCMCGFLLSPSGIHWRALGRCSSQLPLGAALADVISTHLHTI